MLTFFVGFVHDKPYSNMGKKSKGRQSVPAAASSSAVSDFVAEDDHLNVGDRVLLTTLQ